MALLRSQNRPRIGRGDRDVAHVRGAQTYKPMSAPPALGSNNHPETSHAKLSKNVARTPVFGVRGSYFAPTVILDDRRLPLVFGSVNPRKNLTEVRQCRIIKKMSAAIAYTSVYAKRAAKVLRPDERDAMELHVAENPEIHPIVAGTGGVRKARWRRQGKGKRGGVRVIYFYRSAADVVYFLDIYAKAVKEDLTPADKQQLKGLVNRLKGVQ